MKKAVMALLRGALFLVQKFYRKFFVVLVVGAVLLAPRFNLRKMCVTYIDQNTGYVSLVDSEGDVYGIFADELDVGQEILAFCKGSCEAMEIVDYTELEEK